jgi:phosphosulfolactate phosphohydrolase-like enzyme
MKRLRVLMACGGIVPDRLTGATAVVVDVFLATTTLLTVLENGARGVFPVARVGEAEGASELVAEVVGGRLLNASGYRHRASPRPVS